MYNLLLSCLLTNLINREISYRDVFRNILSMELDCGDLLNVHLRSNDWFFLEEESPLGIDKVDPLNLNPTVLGKDPA